MGIEQLLHHVECQQTVKFSYKLSTKALNPSYSERQNVKLVSQIFNNFVSQALLHLRQGFPSFSQDDPKENL